MKKIKLKWLVFSIILLIFILTYCTIQVDKHQNKNDFHWYYKNIELFCWLKYNKSVWV